MAEFGKLAAKLTDNNKAKSLAVSAAAARPRPSAMSAAPTGSGGQINITIILNRKHHHQTHHTTPAPDEASLKGHFGWAMIGKCHIPNIYRLGLKYVAIRMVELKVFNKYLTYLHDDIYSYIGVKSYYMNEVEARLFNEINYRHCECQFGIEAFTQEDLMVRLTDAHEFYKFLVVCCDKLLRRTTNNNDKCGFIRINKKSVVPYTVRDNEKLIPLFYFDYDADNLQLEVDQIEGWDLTYLKFCWVVHGLRKEFLACKTCSVTSLTEIKNYYPRGTEFEEYWPDKVRDFFITTKGSPSSGA